MNLGTTFTRIGFVPVPKQEPTHAELRNKYTNLDEPFGHGKFRRIEQLIGAKVSEEAMMSYATFGVEMTSDAVLGILRQGDKRPAFYEELLGYSDYWWEHLLEKERWMRQTIALGSSLMHEKGRAVAGLVHTIFIGCPDLRLFRYDFAWRPGTRFLIART